MSYLEANIAVCLTGYVMILIYYLAKLIPMLQAGALVEKQVFTLWAVVIVASIVLTILGTILTSIVMMIIKMIRTQSEEPPELIEDERDKLIHLRGDRVAYVVSGIVVFAAMLSYVLNQPALVMFSLLILAGILSEICGYIARLVYYRKGV